MDSQQILDFWFAGETLGKAQITRWWRKDSDIDKEITARFATLVDQVYDGLCDKWSERAEGRLAAIICLDQFPRNMYRGKPASFQYDDRALQLCLAGIDSRAYEKLPLLWQSFYFMPLMHSESTDIHKLSMAHFSRLTTTATGQLKEYLTGSLASAEQHRDIIERFGRYPHRNSTLGRESSAKELEFLQQPGSFF